MHSRITRAPRPVTVKTWPRLRDRKLTNGVVRAMVRRLEALIPVAVLMAMIGYAVGNYAAFATAWLCSLVV